MIVPETDEFKFHVSHGNVVWITKRLGTPQLDLHNAKYIAPFWLSEPVGVNRIYHIKGKPTEDPDSTNIFLGNSFVLSSYWNNVNQRRRFEYRDLAEFGLVEYCDGILLPDNDAKVSV